MLAFATLMRFIVLHFYFVHMERWRYEMGDSRPKALTVTGKEGGTAKAGEHTQLWLTQGQVYTLLISAINC